MGWFTKMTDWLGFVTVRARDEKGRYVADDKSTPNVDESKKRVYKGRSAQKIAAARKGTRKKKG